MVERKLVGFLSEAHACLISGTIDTATGAVFLSFNLHPADVESGKILKSEDSGYVVREITVRSHSHAIISNDAVFRSRVTV